MVKCTASYVSYLQLFLGMALFGSATPLSKLVTKAFPVFIAGGLRVFLAFLVLLPFIKLVILVNLKAVIAGYY
jgi:hypothetical protein